MANQTGNMTKACLCETDDMEASTISVILSICVPFLLLAVFICCLFVAKPRSQRRQPAEQNVSMAMPLHLATATDSIDYTDCADCTDCD